MVMSRGRHEPVAGRLHSRLRGSRTFGSPGPHPAPARMGVPAAVRAPSRRSPSSRRAGTTATAEQGGTGGGALGDEPVGDAEGGEEAVQVVAEDAGVQGA